MKLRRTFLALAVASTALTATAAFAGNHCSSSPSSSDFGYAQQKLHVRCGFEAEGKGEIDCSASADLDRLMPYNGGQVLSGNDDDRFVVQCDGLPACNYDGVVSYKRADPYSSNRDDQFDSYFFSGDDSPLVEVFDLDWDSCSQTRDATLTCDDGEWQYTIEGSCEIERED